MELLKIHHEHFFSQKLRIDGRKFNETRDLLINLDSISSADSSVTLKLGSTTVMCGIKVTINEDVKSLETVNYSDLIDLKVSLHALDEDEGERDEITSLAIKTIKENVLFDHKPLISEDEDGEKRYLILNIELISLNNDGNLFDAFIIAFLAAINSLEIPDYKDIYDEQIAQLIPSSSSPIQTKMETVDELGHLTLIKYPISVTSVLLDDDLILIDPNRDEERLAIGSITTVFDIKSGKIIVLEKKGGSPLEEIQLIEHLTTTKSIGDQIFKTLPFQLTDESMET